MWIQQFQIFKKVGLVLTMIQDSEYYDNQRLAFQWIDENGDKEEEYVILPVITFNNEATHG